MLKSIKKLSQQLEMGLYDIEKFIRRFEFKIATLPSEKRDSSRIRSLFLRGLRNKYIDAILEKQELDVDGLPKQLKPMITVQ